VKLTEYTLKREFKAKSKNQEEYIRAMVENDIVFATGPAGVGKTACAVGYGLTCFVGGQFDKLIITRPTVGTDEDEDKGLGFLPGDLKEKMNPFMRPIYDELNTYFHKDGNSVGRMVDQKIIEIAPLYFMQGRTFHNAFVICDEAQNCTHNQLKMLVTRIGKSSKLVINGDIQQHYRKNKECALETWIKRIVNNIDGIKVCELDKRDIVRHPLVAKILVQIENYEMWRESNA
jgi:phosphate starvation-inducible PhoH-like protein